MHSLVLLPCVASMALLADLMKLLDEQTAEKARLESALSLQRGLIRETLRAINKARREESQKEKGVVPQPPPPTTGEDGASTPVPGDGASGDGAVATPVAEASDSDDDSDSSSSSSEDAKEVEEPGAKRLRAALPRSPAAVAWARSAASSDKPGAKRQRAALPRPSIAVCWACWRRFHQALGGPRHKYDATCLRSSEATPEVKAALVRVAKGGGDSD